MRVCVCLYDGLRDAHGMLHAKKIMWTALFYLLGFDEITHNFGIWKGTNREGPTLHHHLTPPILLSGKLLENTLDNPNSTYFHTATHLHWKARTSRGC